jgi:hypothetical protein
MGRKTDEPGVRELAVVRYPYLIYYEVSGEESGFCTSGMPDGDRGAKVKTIHDIIPTVGIDI